MRQMMSVPLCATLLRSNARLDLGQMKAIEVFGELMPQAANPAVHLSN